MNYCGRPAVELRRREERSTRESKCSDSDPRLAAGLDYDCGEETLFTFHEIPFSANIVLFVSSCWTLVFSVGCCLRVHFAYHWNGYLHVIIPFFGLLAILTAILGYFIKPKFSRKCFLASGIAWILTVLAAIGLIVLSGFVYARFRENRAIEGFRSFFLYGILWIFFTDLLCLVTVIIDSFAVFATYKIWKYKGEFGA
ncbi:hypothetical protein RB195_011035 [Necator americanus]|uniref:Uncharacterized protein n=1 Tax=Necator americanus TaxID=51031 RepID=A0ABR1D1J7_NECAM